MPMKPELQGQAAMAKLVSTLGPLAVMALGSLQLPSWKLSQNTSSRYAPLKLMRLCAGIMGAKQTSQLIPLCHNISLAKVTVSLQLSDSGPEILIRAEAHTCDKTGRLQHLTIACAPLLWVLAGPLPFTCALPKLPHDFVRMPANIAQPCIDWKDMISLSVCPEHPGNAICHGKHARYWAGLVCVASTYLARSQCL